MRRLAIVAAGLAAVAAAALVPASPAAAEIELRVGVGTGGYYTPGDRVPVRVTVTADRLVDGSITATVQLPSGELVSTIPAEVPGGSVKDFWLLVPTSPNDLSRVDVTLRDGDDVLATTRAPLDFRSDQEIVGVLPGLVGADGLPDTVALSIGAGTAKLVAIDVAQLALGAAALDAVDSLAATAGDLETMAPAHRAAVFSWVETGGRLLVDAPLGATVAGAPAAWQPGAAAFARAGQGTVRLTGGALAAGRWSEVVTPAPTRSQMEEGIMTSGLFTGPSIEQQLAGEAGFRVPRLGWLLTGLAVYVLAVGPVTWLVLRRLGRQPLAWLVVPALALVFTAGAFVAGRELRRTATAATATVFTSSDVGDSATTYALVTSRSGGDVRTTFPAGWVAGPALQSFAAETQQLDVASTPERVDARSRLQPGEFSMIEASGPVDLEGGLVVTAESSADGLITGVVRNTLAVALDEVAVFAGRSRATGLGRIEAGEEKPYTIEDASHFEYNAVAESEVWRGVDQQVFDQFGRPMFGTGPVNSALWGAVMQSGGTNFRASGSVVAAGWTAELPAPIEVSGTSGLAGGTAVVVSRAEVRATGPLLTDSSTRRQLVRGPDTVVQPDDNIGAIFEFTLPPSIDGRPPDLDRLEIDVPGLFATADWWHAGRWEAVPRSADPRSVVALPPDLLNAAGSFYVRVGIPPVPPGPGREFVVYERHAL